MTRAAVCQVPSRIDVIPSHQFCAFDLLIWRRLPRHIKNFIARTDIFLRLAMAIETPFHVERLRFLCQRHLIDAPVAGRAADAFCDVNTVIEIDVARQIVNAIPFQRGARRKTLPDRRQYRRIVEDLRMACHAGLSGRQSRERGLFH